MANVLEVREVYETQAKNKDGSDRFHWDHRADGGKGGVSDKPVMVTAERWHVVGAVENDGENHHVLDLSNGPAFHAHFPDVWWARVSKEDNRIRILKNTVRTSADLRISEVEMSLPASKPKKKASRKKAAATSEE